MGWTLAWTVYGVPFRVGGERYHPEAPEPSGGVIPHATPWRTIPGLTIAAGGCVRTTIRLVPLAVLLGSATTLGAQVVSPPAARSAAGIMVGVGLDARLKDGPDFTPQPSLHLAYARRGPHDRVAVRFGIDYATRRLQPMVATANGEPFMRTDRDGHADVLAAGVFASFALTTGRVQPYVLGGVGVHHQWWNWTQSAVALAPGVEVTTDTTTFRGRHTGGALSGGVGLSARARGVTLFAESRVTYLTGAGRSEARAGHAAVALPIIVGLRF